VRWIAWTGATTTTLFIDAREGPFLSAFLASPRGSCKIISLFSGLPRSPPFPFSFGSLAPPAHTS
jgi:hypothetical protein